jgi:hypothetical protein
MYFRLKFVLFPSTSTHALKTAMSKLVTQELAIVVSVKTQTPTILNEDFLKQSGIIPSDWKLAREPVYTDRVAQIVFENGFSIAAQPDRIMFLEAIGDKEIETISAGEVAQKYVATLKLADYQAVGINFRSYVAHNSPAAASEYINNQLLAAGSWQQYGTGAVRASVNLVYDLSERQLNLSINEASIQFPEQPATPVVLFAGNFSYDTSKIPAGDKSTEISKLIGNWKQDLHEYTTLISERFITATPDSEGGSKGKAKSVVEDMEVAYAAELPPVLLTAN